MLCVLLLLLSPNGLANPVQTVDLAGTWSFRPAGAAEMTIEVPGGGWYKQGFKETIEGEYSKSIAIPSIGQPQVTLLTFGAINGTADLYINEKLIESKAQAFTPVVFDLTEHVQPGKTYDIRVHIKGWKAVMEDGRTLIPNAALAWCDSLPQGIYRSAELQIFPQVYIEDVFVRPSVADSSLSYDVWVRNATSSPQRVNLMGKLTSWNGDAWNYPALPSQQVTIRANSTEKVTVGPIPWKLGPDSYWWPNVPYKPGYTAKLHNLNVAIAGGAKHQTSLRFGFRDCLQRPDGRGNTCYYLNGVRVNFRGENLQGANYDRIDYAGGPGDAYDTYPGFLPGENGWPKAVDNFQRLNYNVIRIHQVPATPYMLDVCDEKGMMLIEETAIRGAGDNQDFIKGHDNMVNHLRDLFARDRNHPSIVRQSLCNEPQGSPYDSVQFQTDLYNAAMDVDGTRPLSIDASEQTYEELNHSNFSVILHFEPGVEWGQYTDEIHPRPDRPYGRGEYIWDASTTRQGFAWFGTSMQAMRAKNASDVRPFSLIYAWASVIPGVKTQEMRLEPPPWNAEGELHPLYGEDNLPDPWSNPQIQRVQAGFNPVLVADSEYWEASKLSNPSGDWPIHIPILAPGQSETRKLTVFNDTFSGTDVDVVWELRQNSPTGPITASGELKVPVPLGYRTTREISFTTPDVPSGSSLYLVLSSSKNGEEIFRESSQKFLVFQQDKLTGTPFGSSPPYFAGNEFDKATDGNPDTYFDFSQPDGGIVGIDLGDSASRRISSIVYSPRPGEEARMIGGEFQGSNDGTNYTTIYKVREAPSPQTTVLVYTSQPYRFLRYVSPPGSYGNIADMGFYSSSDMPISGAPFGSGPPFAAGSEFDKALDGNPATFFDFSAANGGYTGIDLGEGNARNVGFIVFTPRANVNDWDDYESRMLGGQFQASTDGKNYKTLHTIAEKPQAFPNSTTVFVNDPTPYRYFRYLSPDNGYANVAEIAFWDSGGDIPKGDSVVQANGKTRARTP